eukprot:XP_022271265.1 uncharacterized protein LOC111094679 isoform X2 [Canis lupus familiaris]
MSSSWSGVGPSSAVTGVLSKRGLLDTETCTRGAGHVTRRPRPSCTLESQGPWSLPTWLPLGLQGNRLPWINQPLVAPCHTPRVSTARGDGDHATVLCRSGSSPPGPGSRPPSCGPSAPRSCHHCLPLGEAFFLMLPTSPSPRAASCDLCSPRG